MSTTNSYATAAKKSHERFAYGIAPRRSQGIAHQHFAGGRNRCRQGRGREAGRALGHGEFGSVRLLECIRREKRLTLDQVQKFLIPRYTVYRYLEGLGYLLDLQADINSHFATRVVAPLLPLDEIPTYAKRVTGVTGVRPLKAVVMARRDRFRQPPSRDRDFAARCSQSVNYMTISLGQHLSPGSPRCRRR